MMNSYPFIVTCGITVMIIQTLSELLYSGFDWKHACQRIKVV